MSERLNSVDIEDVLSSIRRLVSDDNRPAARSAAAPAAVADPQADKLILTPALRIAPEVEPEIEAEAEAEAEAASVAEVTPQSDAFVDVAPEAAPPAEPVMSFHSIRPERGATRLDAVMGQVARGLESGAGEWEAPVEPPTRFESDWMDISADDAGTLEPLDLRDPVAESPAWLEDVAEAPFVDLDDDPVDQAGYAPEPVADAGPDLLQDLPPAEMSPTLVADLSDEGVADAWPTEDWASSDERAAIAPDLPEDAGWAAIAPVSVDHDTTLEPEEPAPATSDFAQPAPVSLDPALLHPVSLDPVALAEEPAMTEIDDVTDPPSAANPTPYAGMAQSEPEAVTDDLPDWARMEAELAEQAEEAPPAAAYQRAAPDPRWADAAEAEIRRELEEETTASAFARFADDDLDDRPFDEDMLRDLVRDIIREELQGALGERITRNVRKLVRAEIARALAVRDFE